MRSDDPAFDKSIDELHSSVRLANILDNAARSLPDWAKEAGLPPPRVLGDLVRWSEKDLYRLRHMGKRTLRELEDLLRQEGLSLRDSDALRCKIQGCKRPAASSATMCDDHRCMHPGCGNSRAHGHQHCHLHVPDEARCFVDGCRKLAMQKGACLEHVGRSIPPTAMANPDAPSISTLVDDLDVIKGVVSLVRGLPPDSQKRVLRAACILLGHDAVFLDDPDVLERLLVHATTLKENQ